MQVNIEFKWINCYCGLTYAIPQHLYYYSCPSCSNRNNELLRKEMIQLNKKISSYKGEITKLKNFKETLNNRLR
jgi:Zn finger protein HypA/HybF involved in hydrogenase expression